MSSLQMLSLAAVIAAVAALIRAIGYWSTRAERNRIERAARLGPRRF